VAGDGQFVCCARCCTALRPTQLADVVVDAALMPAITLLVLATCSKNSGDLWARFATLSQRCWDTQPTVRALSMAASVLSASFCLAAISSLSFLEACV
jgi:hypothetical protein